MGFTLWRTCEYIPDGRVCRDHIYGTFVSAQNLFSPLAYDSTNDNIGEESACAQREREKCDATAKSSKLGPVSNTSPGRTRSDGGNGKSAKKKQTDRLQLYAHS